MRKFYFAIACLTASLFTTTGWSATPAAKFTARVTITVTGINPQIIEADYTLSDPETTLKFSRTAPGLRAQMWVMQTPGLRIQGDEIASTDGKPFDHFRMTVKPYSEFIDLNYVPTDKFSDGSVALFTGYFNVNGKPGQTIFKFVSPDEPVIAYGQSVTKYQTFSPKGDGTFVYFGELKPVETADSVLILDPSLPTWVTTALSREVPAIMAYYTAHYAVKLPRRPFLLFNWINRGTNKTPGLKGDSLYDNISFIVSGADWHTETINTRGQLAKLIAHELAHQWNAYIFSPINFESNGGSWLAEGQAEFAANEVAHHFGWLTTQDVLQNYTTDINDCFQASDAHPIGKQNESEAAIYGCGVIFNLLAQAAMQHHTPRYSFFDLWRAIYADATEHHDKYSAQTYVDTLKRLSGDTQLANLIDTLVIKSAKGKNQALIATLQRLGVGYRRVTHSMHNPDFGQTAMLPLFAAIVKADCHGSISFYTLKDGFRVDPLKGCQTLNRPYSITAVNGQKLFTRGIEAYHAVAIGCAHARKIQLTVRNQKKPLAVKCPAEIPAMPDMIELTKLPWLKPRPDYLSTTLKRRQK